MIHIQRLFDEGVIKRTLTHPRIWPHITDDGSGSPEEFTPIDPEAVLYAGVWDDDKFLGLFLVHRHNTVLFEVHTCLLPEGRGAKAKKSAEALLDWVFTVSPCRKLITHVPVDNLPALLLATSAGLVYEGLNRQSILKGGALLDQHVLGITFAQWESSRCQQAQ